MRDVPSRLWDNVLRVMVTTSARYRSLAGSVLSPECQNLLYDRP